MGGGRKRRGGGGCCVGTSELVRYFAQYNSYISYPINMSTQFMT